MQKMIKFKHNKKKNSALLYEVLVLELTKSILRKDEILKRKITTLLKESFRYDTALHQELKLYHSITKTQNAHPRTAERILSEVLRQRQAMDEKRLLSEQNKLVRQIRKELPPQTLDNFVPSYKSLATIYQIFHQDKRRSIKSKILLENQIIKGMIIPEETNRQKELVPMDNLVYKTFSKRFNATYSSDLLSEQKTLLAKFISSFADNGLELKTYLNDEVARLKKSLKESLTLEEVSSDDEMVAKVNKIITTLENYKAQKPEKEMVQSIIKIQNLVHEIQTDATH